MGRRGPTGKSSRSESMEPSAQFRSLCEQIIEEIGLGSRTDIMSVESLTGGVSSDIALVRLAETAGPIGTVCIKCALPQLKVSATWRAPVRRNLAEYRWLSFVQSILPDAVPKLLGRSERANGFAMQYISPDDAYLYKTALLQGQPDTGQAAQTGRLMATIHSASTKAGFDRPSFDNAPDFYALRLEPYLDFTAARHPTHARFLRSLSAGCDAARIALIHGDVSPKNLLIGKRGPVFLDAECATFGDPAFDLAFFANHLAIKALHLPDKADGLLQAARQFWEQYRIGADWEDIDDLQGRFCALLPALMLARVDGKSPVEYLHDTGRDSLRSVALDLLAMRYDKLDDIIEHIAQHIVAR